MKRKLLSLAGVLVITLALAYVARPVGHIPPYDANLVRLAESARQGYCSGDAFWKSQGTGSARLASACRATSARPNEPDLSAVPPAFCRAIVDDGWTGDVPTCLQIMSDNQYWPTYDGAITDQWNRARPYPVSGLGVAQKQHRDESRTGGRGAPTGHGGSYRTP